MYHYASLRLNRQTYTNGPLKNTRFFMGPVPLRIINCEKYHYFGMAINATLFAVSSINKSGIIDTQFCLPGWGPEAVSEKPAAHFYKGSQLRVPAGDGQQPTSIPHVARGMQACSGKRWLTGRRLRATASGKRQDARNRREASGRQCAAGGGQQALSSVRCLAGLR